MITLLLILAISTAGHADAEARRSVLTALLCATLVTTGYDHAAPDPRDFNGGLRSHGLRLVQRAGQGAATPWSHLLISLYLSLTVSLSLSLCRSLSFSLALPRTPPHKST